MRIEYPTYNQILGLEVGKMVTVTFRAKSGERAEVTGPLHAPGPGSRGVGPFNVAHRRYPNSSIYSHRPLEEKDKVDTVPETVVAIEMEATVQ